MIAGERARAVQEVAFGIREVRDANVDAILAFAGVEAPERGRLARKRAFACALDRLQATPTPGSAPALEPSLLFLDGLRDPLAELVADFTRAEDGTRAPVAAVPPGRRGAVEAGVVQGLALLDAWHPRYGTLVRDLVAAIVVAAGSGVSSATRSSQLAVIYLNPGAHWRALDYAEALLHEAIHVAHYLDQMVSPWFARPHWQLAGEETSVVSSIRRVRRPLPLALEACCVSTVLVDLLWWAGAHERSTSIGVSTTASLLGIRELGQHLTPRGCEIVEDLSAILGASPALAAVA